MTDFVMTLYGKGQWGEGRELGGGDSFDPQKIGPKIFQLKNKR